MKILSLFGQFNQEQKCSDKWMGASERELDREMAVLASGTVDRLMDNSLDID